MLFYNILYTNSNSWSACAYELRNFVAKIAKISVTTAIGSVGTNFNDTIKLADPENPQFATRIWDRCISYYTSRIRANFMFKYPRFCYHGNMGRSGTSLNGTDKLAVFDPIWHKNHGLHGIISYIQSTTHRKP